jgi:hypothetical protein
MISRAARWTVIVALAAGGVVAAACNAGDDTLPGNPYDGGASSSGGGDGTVDGLAEPDTLLPPGAPLCAKYGADIAGKVANTLIANVSADCRISAYFAGLQDGTHFADCLTKQIGTFFQCPGVVYDKDSQGKACRSMLDAHKNVNPQIRNADFSAFVEDAIAAMRANGIADPDITAVSPTFVGTKTSVVQNIKGIGDGNCTCPNLTLPDGGYCGTDAGIDASEAGLEGGPEGGSDASDSGGGG